METLIGTDLTTTQAGGHTDLKTYQTRKGALLWGATNSGKTYRSARHFARRCALRPAKHLLIGANLRLVRGEVIPLIRYHARNYGIASTPYNTQTGTFTVGPSIVYVVAGARAGDEDRLRTYHNIDSIMAEEVTAQPEVFYDMALTRQGPWLGPVWATCNPSHPMNWVKVRLDAGRWFHDEMFLVSDNPSLTDEQRLAFEAQFVGTFRLRMIEALWAAPEGLVYPHWKETPDYDPALDSFVGVDYGESGVTAAVFFQRHGDHFSAVSEYYHNGYTDGQRDSDGHARAIKEIAPGRLQGAWVDPTAVELKAALRRQGITVNNGYNQEPGYNITDGALQKGQLRINTSRCKQTVMQLYSLVYNKLMLKPDPNCIDHATDALRYGWCGITPLRGVTVG